MTGPGAKPPPQEPAKGSPLNHALLYIEDNEDNIRLVQRLLKRRPRIELHLARNGRDGVQAAIGKRPGLILLDNRLPDATGGEILRELTATATASIPVIILSGDSTEILHELLAGGATEYLAKPFNLHQFLATIDRYLP
jgi:CheY-like chemotaxis protein